MNMDMSKKQERLGKSLGFFSAYAIGTGTMIGAGIFVLPSLAIATAGPAAVLSFILGGLITLATTFSVVELATAMPRAGGSYYFISRAFGPMIGTIIGLGAWLSLVFKGSFALIGLAEYLNVLLPAPVLITALVVGILLLIINYRGAKSSGNLQNLIVVGLMVILAAFILGGTPILEKELLMPFMPYGVASVLETTGIIFISYLGITQLAAISEEIKNPSRNIPRAFFGSVITVILIYAGVIIVVNGIVPLEELLNTNTPLVYAANLMLGTPGGIIITLAGLFATISTANAGIMSSSRFPFAMARDQLLPHSLVDVHEKYQTPYRSILVTGIVMLALLVLFDVEQLSKLGSTVNIMIFVLINFSVIVYRRNKDKEYQPTFKDPLFPLTQIIGIVGSLMLLPSLGLFPLVFAVIIIILGSAWYLLKGRDKIEFSYSIKSYLDEGEIPVDVNENEERILVPVSHPQHEKDLLYLADRLGDVIIGLNVIRVPDQTALTDAREYYHEDKEQEDIVLEKVFDDWAKLTSHKQKYIVDFDHDVSNAILEQSEKEKADLILMGWQRQKRLQYAIGGITYRILTNAKSHVAVLKGHLPQDPKKIVVAYDETKHNSKYGLLLGKKLALNTGATLKVLRVINPDMEEEEKKKILENLKEASKSKENISIEYHLIEKYSATDAILQESKNSDLTIIGDSSKRFKRNFLSTLPQRVATHSKNPILIIKRYQSATKYLKFFE